jgi:hypothetical protein
VLKILEFTQLQCLQRSQGIQGRYLLKHPATAYIECLQCCQSGQGRQILDFPAKEELEGLQCSEEARGRQKVKVTVTLQSELLKAIHVWQNLREFLKMEAGPEAWTRQAAELGDAQRSR